MYINRDVVAYFHYVASMRVDGLLPLPYHAFLHLADKLGAR